MKLCIFYKNTSIDKYVYFENWVRECRELKRKGSAQTPTCMHAHTQAAPYENKMYVCMYMYICIVKQKFYKITHILTTWKALCFLFPFLMLISIYKVDYVTYQWVTIFNFKTLI